jgi:uncharacterized protein YjgD (DUF1641 family)
MAKPVPFQAAPRNTLDELRAALDKAPERHAAAVLAAFELLQQLHDRGVLDLVSSGLAAGDELLASIVGGLNTPEAVRALRNLLFWQGVLGQIEPAWFQSIFRSIPDGLALAAAQRDEPASLWKILRRAVSKDGLRGLRACVDLIESFGRHLNALEHSVGPRQPQSSEADQ